MVSLSRTWGYVLLLLQVVNAVAAALTYAAALPLPETTKAQVLAWNVGIAAVVGAIQAFTKALTDADGNGIPDLFEKAQ